MADNHSDNLPQRRSVRLAGYDYTQAGAYYVTVCTHDGLMLFGRVDNGLMHRTPVGQLAHEFFLAIPQHHPNVELDCFVVMPNHVHGILVLFRNQECGRQAALAPAAGNSSRAVGSPDAQDERLRDFGRPVAGSLGSIVGKYKAAVTREARRRCGDRQRAVWQGNYWEHIIRDDRELKQVRRYILENPLQWSIDRENPEASGTGSAPPWEEPS